MTTILIVDDMAIFRDPIAASLQMAGYSTITVGNGVDALKRLRESRVDLVLLDMAMPQMDGLTVLATMRRASALASTPVILLTALSDREHVLQAAKLGVQDYLLKSSFSVKELLMRVRKYLPAGDQAATQISGTTTPAEVDAPPQAPLRAAVARSGEEVLLTREQCIERAESALAAKTLSGVVAQVIAMAANPRSDLSQLANLVGRDPLLSARVLQAANSAAYASNKGVVTTLSEAVRNVGCSTVRNIATACGIFEAMPETAPDGFNPIRCWQHSFAVATLCEMLCQSYDPEQAGLAHVVGLCHDLGVILLRTHFGAEYRQVLESHEQTGERLDRLERRMLGLTRGELVKTIIGKMGLPESIRTPIEAFHDDPNGASHPLARLLRVSNLYANGLGLASSGMSRFRPITRGELRQACGLEDPARPDAQRLRCEIYALTAALARLSPRDEAALMSPIHRNTGVRVWLARDSGLSGFDPLTAALETMADVTCDSRLPLSADELEGVGALVVAARTPSAAGLTAADIQRARDLAPNRLSVLWITAPMGNDTAQDQPEPWPISLDRLASVLSSGSQAAIAA